MMLQLVKDKIIISLLLLLIIFMKAEQNHAIAVIGTGYVGLVSGACLADIGNCVTCVDIDSSKIKSLNNGVIPIYEQGLKDIVNRNVEAGRLCFSDAIDHSIQESDIVIVAVGTPMDNDGSADLSYIYRAIETIARNLNSYKIIVIKSTVPVGTGKKIREHLEKGYSVDSTLFSLASNPEFLREGFAVYDFLHPDRLVIGTDSDKALVALCEIYEPLITSGTNCVLTDISTSEMIKYASNGFLSVKISYINEIANLCDKMGADVKTVAYAMGLDPRIGPDFLQPGPGFGGSCFPKDSQALVYIAQQHNLPFYTVQAALDANKIQQTKPVEKLTQLLKDKYQQSLANKRVAVLGLAFKANTDDVRYSPAITTIQLLLDAGATVVGYDPIAVPNMRHIFPDILYEESPYKALVGADAAVIITEWDEIKQIDFARVKQCMNQPIIIDARNIINPQTLKQLGFMCDSIGQSYLCKKQKKYIRKFVPIHLHKSMPLQKIK